jgi:hypothetical protein
LTPDEAAQKLADTMNEIEGCGYLLYPHPRPCAISIRILKPGYTEAKHPDDTRIVAQLFDAGDGLGWRLKVNP